MTNEVRLIDANAFIDQFDGYGWGEECDGEKVLIALYDAPTVDAIVPPVKVGQIVYAALRPWEATPDVQPFQVTDLRISQNKKGVWTKKFGAYWYRDGKTVDVGHNFRFDEVGEKVFLTEKEAKATLLPKQETVFTHGGW